MLFKLQLRDIK